MFIGPKHPLISGKTSMSLVVQDQVLPLSTLHLRNMNKRRGGVKSSLQLKNPYKIYKICKVLNEKCCTLKSSFVLTLPDKQVLIQDSKFLHNCVMLCTLWAQSWRFLAKRRWKEPGFSPRRPVPTPMEVDRKTVTDLNGTGSYIFLSLISSTKFLSKYPPMQPPWTVKIKYHSAQNVSYIPHGIASRRNHSFTVVLCKMERQ